MSNKDRAAGLIPVRHYAGGVVRENAYYIADGYNTDIYRNDLVKSTGTGRNIARAGAGDRAVGVFAGCRYTDTSGEEVFSQHWPANTSLKAGTRATAMVFDDPNIAFEIQASGAVAEGDIGGVADINAGTGSDSTGVSAVELDSTSIAATGSAQLKILERVERDDNVFGTRAKLLVLINEHELHGARTAV